MECLFVVYHDLETEERSNEILQMLEKFGRTTVVCWNKCSNASDSTTFFFNKEKKRGIIGFFYFMCNVFRAVMSCKPDLVILHDSYGAFFYPLVRVCFKNAWVGHDSSELYLLSDKIESKHINNYLSRISLVTEKILLKHMDFVIAANLERALIMKQYYGLKEIPIIFDNMHKNLVTYDEQQCAQKYGNLFEGKFTALYAGGIAERRLTYTMAKQIGLLGEDYQLLILGAQEYGGEQKLNSVLEDRNIVNVKYLGFVDRGELKYLMEHSQVNISAFAMDKANNINCASGKVYEGLFLGKPLLAGINPPLKRLCEEHGVGVSTDDFGTGLVCLRENYDWYCKNVTKYVENIEYDKRIPKLKEQIEEKIR